MLDSSYKSIENAIEEVVYDFLKDCDLTPMSEESSLMFLEIGMMPKSMKLPKENQPILFQILQKRIEHCYTFKVTDERVLLALTLWCESAGVGIIYLWYIQGWCFKNNVREVDFDILATRIFASGVFSEKDMKSVWDNQKVQRNNMDESDNLIDYNIAGLSIQFIN
jgi:hypothetical protein